MHTLTYTARMDKMYTISYDNVSRKRKQLKKNLVVHFGFCLVQLRLTPIETMTIWIHTEMHTAHAKMMSKSLASKFQMSEPAIQFKCENKCVETNPNCNICVTQFTDFCSLFLCKQNMSFRSFSFPLVFSFEFALPFACKNCGITTGHEQWARRISIPSFCVANIFPYAVRLLYQANGTIAIVHRSTETIFQ